jgi:hypothetical protein
MTARDAVAAAHSSEVGERAVSPIATEAADVPAMRIDENGGSDPAACGLSVRALNVLKLLAAEMTGEVPPKRDWVPSNALLREVTFERLAVARNCGPLTTGEIIRWAGSRGVAIAPPPWSGRSLPQMWRYLEARFSAGDLTRAELTDALERSVRRKSTRIPIGVQRILLKLLDQPDGGPRQP